MRIFAGKELVMNLQEVENAIKAMNQAAFQELGDLFMISKNRDYSAFVCTGSQYGKQKTTKGTPDTFILTHDGKYIMVEYSTNETKKEKKLIEDFEKCLNEKGIEKMNMLLSKKEDLDEIIEKAYEMIMNSRNNDKNEQNFG